MSERHSTGKQERGGGGASCLLLGLPLVTQGKASAVEKEESKSSLLHHAYTQKFYLLFDSRHVGIYSYSCVYRVTSIFSEILLPRPDSLVPACAMETRVQVHCRRLLTMPAFAVDPQQLCNWHFLGHSTTFKHGRTGWTRIAPSKDVRKLLSRQVW